MTISEFKCPEPFIPYGRQWIDENDIDNVVEILKSDWLTTGPKVEEFEQAFGDFVGAKYAVSVSSGTAALHSVMYALGIKEGDEVIVPAMTFAATANSVVFQRGTPVFADVDPETLLIDPIDVESKISGKTKAIVAVDYAGQPCDYDTLKKIAEEYDLALVDDACHAIGGHYKGIPVGSLADLNTFSFHPVKHITTGEGGMITTDDHSLANKMRNFRNHGITTNHRQRAEQGSWFYEMVDLGYNYRMTDFQCALGMSQLRKLPNWIKRRQEIARLYDRAFYGSEFVRPLLVRPEISHAYHLYVVRVSFDQLNVDRSRLFALLRESGIGVNIHFIPVYLHPFYQKNYGTKPGLCPITEAAYKEILSLPMFPQLNNYEVDKIVELVLEFIKKKTKARDDVL